MDEHRQLDAERVAAREAQFCAEVAQARAERIAAIVQAENERLRDELAAEREAVEKLASSIVFETRHMDPEPCAHGRGAWDQPIDCPAPSSFDPPCAACWAEWARKQAAEQHDRGGTNDDPAGD